MSNEAVEHDYNANLQSASNTYPCEKIEWQTVRDDNANNYSQGMVNFNSVNHGGLNANIQCDPSKIYYATIYLFDEASFSRMHIYK